MLLLKRLGQLRRELIWETRSRNYSESNFTLKESDLPGMKFQGIARNCKKREKKPMRIWWTPWLPSGGFHFLHRIWEKLRNSPFPALVKSSFPWLSKHVKFFILLVSRSGSYIYIHTEQSKMKGPTLRLVHWNKLAAFNCASKVIRDFFGFALPRSRATISANQMQD